MAFASQHNFALNSERYSTRAKQLTRQIARPFSQRSAIRLCRTSLSDACFVWRCSTAAPNV